jgi:drug/metabolite transporter (DMT)-like permease
MGDVFLKKGAVLTGCLVYILATGTWFVALRAHDFTKATVVACVLTLLLSCIAGYFAFDDELTIKQVIGIVLGCAVVYLMEV